MPTPAPLASATRRRQTAFLFAVLAASSAAALALVAARVFYTGSSAHLFMVWNLFLAWIPLWLAAALYDLDRRGVSPAPLLGLGFFWLLFFPNAPYLLTEFLHLHPDFAVRERPLHVLAGISPLRDAPLWYDVALLVACAWNGLLLGVVSLHLVQAVISRRLGKAQGWAAVVAILGLSGFGVSLGRFQRWNSWDLFSRPAALLADVASRVFNPLAHPRTTAVTVLMWSFLLLTYLALGAFASIGEES